jgi:hypothetical protein
VQQRAHQFELVAPLARRQPETKSALAPMFGHAMFECSSPRIDQPLIDYFARSSGIYIEVARLSPSYSR